MGSRPVAKCSTGKVRYRDKLGAKIELAKVQHEDHGERRVYRCEFCRGWHLTSQSRRPADA